MKRPSNISNLSAQIEDYLKNNLGINVTVAKSKLDEILPILFLETYHFYECKLFNQDFFLIEPFNGTNITPAIISKHTKKIQSLVNREIIFVTMGITSYDRKRLIEHKVSFIVPNNQMYLPILGMDLRNHFRKIRSNTIKKISPATQAVILYIIYNKNEAEISALSLSKKLHYSPMTMGRSLDELEALNLGSVKFVGRNRIFTLAETCAQLWEQAKPFMQTPISRIVNIDYLPSEIKPLKSGYTGLSTLTMISDTMPLTFAVSLAHWKIIESNKKVKILPASETESIRVEIWKYNPLLFSNNIVDKLSLYLCFQNTNDERTALAREQLLESLV